MVLGDRLQKNKKVSIKPKLKLIVYNNFSNKILLIENYFKTIKPHIYHGSFG